MLRVTTVLRAGGIPETVRSSILQDSDRSARGNCPHAFPLDYVVTHQRHRVMPRPSASPRSLRRRRCRCLAGTSQTRPTPTAAWRPPRAGTVSGLFTAPHARDRLQAINHPHRVAPHSGGQVSAIPETGVFHDVSAAPSGSRLPRMVSRSVRPASRVGSHLVATEIPFETP